VIQQEVYPPMTLNNRKFVIRAHVLLTLDILDSSKVIQDNVYLNRNLIVLEFGNEFGKESKQTKDKLDRNHYISSSTKIKSRPKPYIMSGDIYHEIFRQMIDIVSRIHRNIHLKHIVSSIIKDHDSLKMQKYCENEKSVVNNLNETINNLHYYHLFGYDFMVTEDSKLFLLEVNANPAIASGTMKDVPKCVYHDLLHDVLKLVVLPVTNGLKKETGSFVSCI